MLFFLHPAGVLHSPSPRLCLKPTNHCLHSFSAQIWFHTLQQNRADDRQENNHHNRRKEIAPPQRAIVAQLGLGFGVVLSKLGFCSFFPLFWIETCCHAVKSLKWDAQKNIRNLKKKTLLPHLIINMIWYHIFLFLFYFFNNFLERNSIEHITLMMNNKTLNVIISITSN